MPRDIRFRAWDKLNQKMAYGAEYNLVVTLNNPQDYETMQYTELNDRDGNNVYEGDVLDFHSLRKYVAWNQELGCWGLRNTNPEYKKIVMQLATVDLKNSVVVGNIYENKELLV